MGAAGIGLVSFKGAAVSMPSVATPEFGRFWQIGRALHVILPTGSDRFQEGHANCCETAVTSPRRIDRRTTTVNITTQSSEASQVTSQSLAANLEAATVSADGPRTPPVAATGFVPEHDCAQSGYVRSIAGLPSPRRPLGGRWSLLWETDGQGLRSHIDSPLARTTSQDFRQKPG